VHFIELLGLCVAQADALLRHDAQAGFLDHERTCKNIRLFAKDVYPAIKDLAGTRPLDLPIAAE
jgi:hypothetical protein